MQKLNKWQNNNVDVFHFFIFVCTNQNYKQWVAHLNTEKKENLSVGVIWQSFLPAMDEK